MVAARLVAGMVLDGMGNQLSDYAAGSHPYLP
jgi:hypothetical protein